MRTWNRSSRSRSPIGSFSPRPISSPRGRADATARPSPRACTCSIPPRPSSMPRRTRQRPSACSLAAEAYADADHRQHGHHHDVNRHDDRVRAFSFASEAAMPAATFDMFLDLLRSLHGPNLLRLKGIVKLAETPATPVVVHGVQHVLHPVVQLPHWPDGDERTRIVVIARDVKPSAVRALFDAFLDAAAPDQPDRAALVDNPLVPFAGRDR